MKKGILLEEINKKELPLHIAFILDGNGRWATSKGLPRTMGHQKGAKTKHAGKVIHGRLLLTCTARKTVPN